ncbi:hypothetical protein SAMN06273572_103160 [Monaibacterium marinum]|uniref:DUF3298 domain-containing protein n=1 Tax=Pontivivens marinum TaxID=1690039 RepID=A0A2C9CSE4_9RHOB|nr:hypothetical protein [Monaibacterium marinum]SOH94133.1 hypothetical protein SAMN06273572_103160 [Monaibacterium marinum]
MKTLVAFLMLMAPVAVSAQTIPLSGGRMTQVVGFTIERDGMTGINTLQLALTPDFNPEPHGPVPPTDVARDHRSICQRVAPMNAGLMAEHNATRFAVRWDWTPEQQDQDFTVSRFHTNAFTVTAQGDCELAVGVGVQHPTLLSGTAPRLIGSETITDRRLSGLGLEMLYDLGQPMTEEDRPARSRAAIELCLTVVEDEMRRREDNYHELDYDFLAVGFVEELAPGDILRDSYVFALDDGHCVTDLPKSVIADIRAAAQ